jgi:glycolate oxidase FAD binding subunit
MGPGLVEAIAGALDARWYYDWSGGLIWLSTPAMGDAGAAAIRGAVARAGGHATLVRAPMEVRAAVDVFQPLSEPLMRVSAGVKASLDPAGVFNPGRMYAGV